MSDQEGEVTDSFDSKGKGLDFIKKLDKKTPAGEFAISLGLIKNVYQDSIEYTGVVRGTRGWIMFFGILGGLTFTSTGAWGVMEFFDRGINGILDVIFLSVSVCTIIGALYLATNSVRLELFRPVDEPIIFDRKHRKIYRIFRESFSGWRGLFMRWPLRFSEYDWELIDAEHQAIVANNGSTIMRYHALMFLVRKSQNDFSLDASFIVGNSSQMGELTVPAVWEHIRRFMEENGPHLPLGETLSRIDGPVTLWSCLAASGPYGKNFLIWWKEIELLLILVVLFSPILLPIFTLVSIFAWLSYRTSTPIEWPKHVQEAVTS